MGYIFAFGTGSAVRTSGCPTWLAASALLVGASASASETPVPVTPAISASIDLAITGLRSKKGNVLVALIHDENANGKMDMRLFLPREGFGFSRNPKIRMGPPKFESSQFTVGAQDAHYAVHMNYIL